MKSLYDFWHNNILPEPLAFKHLWRTQLRVVSAAMLGPRHRPLLHNLKIEPTAGDSIGETSILPTAVSSIGDLHKYTPLTHDIGYQTIDSPLRSIESAD